MSAIREKRKELGLTIKQAAALLGKGERTLRHWEHGDRREPPGMAGELQRQALAANEAGPDSLRGVRQEFGLTILQAAAMLNVREETVSGWENGRQKEPAFAARVLRTRINQGMSPPKSAFAVKRERVEKVARWAIACQCPLEVKAWVERFGDFAATRRILFELGLQSAIFSEWTGHLPRSEEA